MRDPPTRLPGPGARPGRSGRSRARRRLAVGQLSTASTSGPEPGDHGRRAAGAGGPPVAPPGSISSPDRAPTRSLRASRPALLYLFALGTPRLGRGGPGQVRRSAGRRRAAAVMKTFGPSSSATRGRSRGRSSCSSSRSTGGGPRSASRRRDARAWWPSSSRPG